MSISNPRELAGKDPSRRNPLFAWYRLIRTEPAQDSAIAVLQASAAEDTKEDRAAGMRSTSRLPKTSRTVSLPPWTLNRTTQPAFRNGREMVGIHL